MKFIKKLKLSKVMADWNLRGWIDKKSPAWFRLIFWTLYHIYHEDKFLTEHSNKKVES